MQVDRVTQILFRLFISSETMAHISPAPPRDGSALGALSYFFLRRGDTMRNLICWCPQTHKPIDLQLFTDYATLARIWSSSVRFDCPHCGGDHETKVAAACLQTTLARTALSETHEASEPRVVG